MTDAKPPEADLDSLLSSEEIEALGEDPRKGVIRLIAWGALLLAIVSIGSWLWREAQAASSAHEARMTTFSTIAGKTRDASSSELIELDAQWAQQVDQGREVYGAKSRRRKEFELGAAASGVALSTAILDNLAHPGSLDLGDQIRLALGLRRIATDSSVLAISRINPGPATSALLDVTRKGGAYLATLSPQSTLENLAQGAAVAAAISSMAPREQRQVYRSMADSLREEISRRVELGERNTPTGAAPSTEAQGREEVAGVIREYLKQQGVAVTFAGTDGPDRKHLVIKGLGRSDELGVLITASPQAMSRLAEAGFTEVHATGTTGAERVTRVPPSKVTATEEKR